MRSLSSTLLAAQKQASALPYVRAVLSDYHGDVTRIRFARHYQGSEGDYFSAVVGAGDGSLIRARIDPATHVLYTQRVVNPGPASNFGSWTSQGSVSSTAGVALAVSGGSVFLFYVDTDNTTLRLKQSSDNGAGYGSPVTVATAAAPVTYLAAAVAPSGDRLLLWAEGAGVYTSRYSSGAWGARTAWSNSAASITGIACRHRLDFDVALCGTEPATGDAKVWTAIYGDGVEQSPDAWSSLSEVATASAGSDVSFHSPALELLQHWRLFFVETYAGTQAYSRLQWSTMDSAATFTNELWREPVAFDYEGDDYGVSATASNLNGYLWLSSALGVWSGRSPAYDDLDVSEDVIEATVRSGEDGGVVRMVLRNDPASSGIAGRYASYGSGGLSVIQRGVRLQLMPGYYTTEGPETPLSASYWVESIEQATGPSPALVIQARDAWWLLERWRARHQFYWPEGTRAVSQLLQFVCARAGLGLTFLNSSDAVTDLEPAFTIHPGESGRTAVQRLLAMVPDVAFAQGGGLRMRFPQSDDDIEYEYAAPGDAPASKQVIVSARYRDAGPAANRVRVLGDSVIEEGFDFGDIESAGERNLQVIDLNIASAAEAADRAEFELRAAAMASRRDEMRLAGVNCGQELYDVIGVSDPQAGMVDAKRRVVGLSWRYQSASAGGTPRYEMTLELGNP